MQNCFSENQGKSSFEIPEVKKEEEPGKKNHK